ncbi:type II toxin-antitoxin system HicA family toxin [Coprobacter fastidiosus]|jgi:predicted RNA binding protein YcfA (HicA-like mRNA interferase family)|uniref:type II toxin-antitoxin system HicA family toxin n=1 Tax=Coprobacter fastidiosus TaxID=1099853 RepID=UPI0026087A71|nr:type II toxin-antitoxin system HicA family toxin [Coprobacter fastidiosus]
MKTSEITKLLNKAGCYVVRHGSRHDLWFSPITGKIFSVPRHTSKEIPSGTARSIKKDAGI